MALSNSEKNSIATKFAADAGYASLHSADPGQAGANEISGGAPAYARKALTWGAAGNGVVATTSGAVFDVAAGTSVAFIGFWSAANGGTFLGSQGITTESFAGQGTYTLSSVSYTQS